MRVAAGTVCGYYPLLFNFLWKRIYPSYLNTIECILTAMSIVVNRDNIYQTQITAYDDFMYQRSVLANRIWEEEVVEAVLTNYEPGTDVVDVGANIGLIALGVLQRAKERGVEVSRIHCFECDTNTFQLLRLNVAPFSKSVSLYPFALGERFQLCNIQMLENNEGCNHIYRTIDEEGGRGT